MFRNRTIKRQILEFIRRYNLAHGCSPSHREIMDAVGIRNISTVNYHLVDLRHHGFIDYENGVSRSVRIVQFED